MSSLRPPVHRVGLCAKPRSAPAQAAARELAQWLAARGVEVLLDDALGTGGAGRGALAEKVDLLVVLGGDGTLLSVAREMGARAVPILGVNLGTLGFLAEFAPAEERDVLERVLRGDYATVERMRLDVRVVRGGHELLRSHALNDAVITRADLSRMIDLEATADGVPVTTYHGDGLIVATPTGSTAYTLSAGGPILMPGARVFVLTPICPHALAQRPLVLPDTTALVINVHPRDGAARLTVDGQLGLALDDGDRIEIATSAHPAHFVASPFRSRFDVLRTKLGWGAA
ncbi:MAG TPA: NAD(+)/NADH kinase [Myxococcota bacterium]|jgi:NAD+ kinase